MRHPGSCSISTILATAAGVVLLVALPVPGRAAPVAAAGLVFELHFDRTAIRVDGAVSGEMIVRNTGAEPRTLGCAADGSAFGGVVFLVERGGDRVGVGLGCYECISPVGCATAVIAPGAQVRGLFYLGTTRYSEGADVVPLFPAAGTSTLSAVYPWVEPGKGRTARLVSPSCTIQVTDGSGRAAFAARVGAGERVGVFTGGTGYSLTGSLAPDDPAVFGDYAEEYAVFIAYQYGPKTKALLNRLDRDVNYACVRVRDDIVGGLEPDYPCAANAWRRAAAFVYDRAYATDELADLYAGHDVRSIIAEYPGFAPYEQAIRGARVRGLLDGR